MQFLNKEVFVNHILFGHEEAALRVPVKRSKEEAFFLADSIKKSLESILSKKEYKDYVEVFSNQASLFSDDPSVSQNKGVVGWVSWGQTVSEFQSAAFGLDVGKISNPILTNFGYHLIIITDIRDSDYKYMKKDSIEINLWGDHVLGIEKIA